MHQTVMKLPEGFSFFRWVPTRSATSCSQVLMQVLRISLNIISDMGTSSWLCSLANGKIQDCRAEWPPVAIHLSSCCKTTPPAHTYQTILWMCIDEDKCIPRCGIPFRGAGRSWSDRWSVALTRRPNQAHGNNSFSIFHDLNKPTACCLCWRLLI